MSIIPKKIVGIEVHDYSAHLVEMKLLHETVSLEAYNRIIIPSNIIREGEIVDKNELKPLIKRLFQEANPEPVETKDIALVLPSSKIFTHIFALPLNLNKEEVKQALPYKVETVIPFAMEDVYWDATLLDKAAPSEKRQMQYILFVAISKTTADAYISLLQSLDLIPILFGAHCEALQHAFCKQVSKNESALIVDMDTVSTNYLILHGEKIRHFLSYNNGGKKLVAKLCKSFEIPENIILEQKEKGHWDPKYVPNIQKFLKRNYKIAQEIIADKESNPAIGNIAKILLTGEYINLPNFFDIATKEFSEKAIEIGDPTKDIVIEKTKFIHSGHSDNAVPYSTYFLHAIGIALRGLLAKPKEGINLLPDQLKSKLSGQRAALFQVVTSVIMSALALFLATFIFFKHQDLIFERRYLEVQKSSVDKLLYGTRYQEIRDAINYFNDEVIELNTIENSLFSVPKFLENLSVLVPKGLNVKSVSFNDKDLMVEINGVADTRDHLLEATQKFKEAPFISEVITPISNYDEKFQISFSIKLQLLFKELPVYGTTVEKL